MVCFLHPSLFSFHRGVRGFLPPAFLQATSGTRHAADRRGAYPWQRTDLLDTGLDLLDLTFYWGDSR